MQERQRDETKAKGSLPLRRASRHQKLPQCLHQSRSSNQGFAKQIVAHPVQISHGTLNYQ